MARRKKQLTQREVENIRVWRQDFGQSADTISNRLGIPLDLVMEFVVYLDGEAGNSATSTLKKRRSLKDINEPLPVLSNPITVDEILDVAKIKGKDLWRNIFGGK